MSGSLSSTRRPRYVAPSLLLVVLAAVPLAGCGKSSYTQLKGSRVVVFAGGTHVEGCVSYVDSTTLWLENDSGMRVLIPIDKIDFVNEHGTDCG